MNMNGFMQPSGKPVLQGVLIFAFGTVLLLYALGILEKSVTVFMVLVALGLMVAGFWMAGFYEALRTLLAKKKGPDKV